MGARTKSGRRSTVVENWMESIHHGDLLLGKLGHRRTDEVLEEIRIGVDQILLENIWKRFGEWLTLVGGRPIVESREHLEQPDRRSEKLIAREAREMRQEFIRRGNSVSTVGIRLLEKSEEIPSAVECRRSPGRVNPVKNFG